MTDCSVLYCSEELDFLWIMEPQGRARKSSPFFKEQANGVLGIGMDSKWIFLLAVFPACALAGLAALFKSEDEITYRAIVSSVLNSGLFGVVIGGAGLHFYGCEAIVAIFAAAIFAGLLGDAGFNLVFEMVKGYINRRNGKAS